MCLYEKFLSLENTGSSYYYNEIKYKRPITNSNKAWDFIKEYFEAGRKESALQEKNIKLLKEKGKHLHTVSMYFIGVLMRNMFEEKITNKLFINPNEGEIKYRYDFTYIWFLTCLFHDFSYIHENDKINDTYLDPESCFSINLVDKFEIKHNILNHKLSNGDNFKTHYHFETIKNYFYYRCKEWRKLDHGIIGGMLLFDRLIKNYYESWENYKKCGSDHTGSFKEFNYRERSWRREHHDYFAYMADTIISHNIWLGTDENLYSEYNIVELLQSNSNRLSIDANPLLFMLGLLDTIEPIKFFAGFSPEYIWNNIDIQTDSNVVTVTVSDSAIFNYLEWFNKIDSLNDWLCVSTNKEKRKVDIWVNYH